MTQKDENLIDVLDKELTELIASFGGKVTHNTRGPFLGEFKKILKKHNVRGGHWLDALLKKRGL